MSFHKVRIDQGYQCLLSQKDTKGQVRNPVTALQCKFKLAYKDALYVINQLEKHELISCPFIDSPNTRLILDTCSKKSENIVPISQQIERISLINRAQKKFLNGLETI